jgi:hypothetical protein
MDADDPIIAAIDAHRRACSQTRAAFERQSAVENELVVRAGCRRVRWKMSGLLPML